MMQKNFLTAGFDNNSKLTNVVLMCLLLVIVTLAVYMQVANHPFFYMDDALYITLNTHVNNGISGQNIVWAFTSVDEANWHPLTWLSHMTDVQLYGLNPRGHHLTNVFFHTVSALILFMLLLRLTGAQWQSLFVAALFALHPLHVESVAWVAERKDVLSAFFGFLSLLFYSEYVARQRSLLYLLALFFFLLGLMSKPMLVTLPAIMLLIDFWPLNRFHAGKIAILIKEKTPFILCSLCSGLVTIYAQYNAGAVRKLWEFPFRLRFENALVAYVKYICKTFWPIDLANFYPFPFYIPTWQIVSSVIALLLLSVIAIRTTRHHPYFTVGWFWFLITLIPVIGLIQVGVQSMADRYSYIPIVGLFIIVAWGVPDLLKGGRFRQVILASLAGVVLSLSVVLTWFQVGYWRDNSTNYQHTQEVIRGQISRNGRY